MKKQRAERQLRKEDIETDLTEEAVKPKDAKRVSKPIQPKPKPKPKAQKNPKIKTKPKEDMPYKVERFVGEEVRTENGRKIKYYRVKWEGYDELTWEPRKNLLKDLGKTFFRKKEQEWKKTNKS